MIWLFDVVILFDTVQQSIYAMWVYLETLGNNFIVLKYYDILPLSRFLSISLNTSFK